MIKQLAFKLILITPLLFISMAQARTAKLYCQNESQTWPQSGKIYSSNKIMFLRVEFSSDGKVKIYQGQKKNHSMERMIQNQYKEIARQIKVLNEI